MACRGPCLTCTLLPLNKRRFFLEQLNPKVWSDGLASVSVRGNVRLGLLLQIADKPHELLSSYPRSH